MTGMDERQAFREFARLWVRQERRIFLGTDIGFSADIWLADSAIRFLDHPKFGPPFRSMIRRVGVLWSRTLSSAGRPDLPTGGPVL